MIEKIRNFLSGKKAYIIAILIGIGAVAIQLGYTIPEWVWAILAALGLGAIRAAISKLKKE